MKLPDSFNCNNFAVVFILLINSYNSNNASNVVSNNSNQQLEGFYADGEDVEESPVARNMNMEVKQKKKKM